MSAVPVFGNQLATDVGENSGPTHVQIVNDIKKKFYRYDYDETGYSDEG